MAQPYENDIFRKSGILQAPATNYRRGYATRLEVPRLGHLYCVYLQAD
eukprot:SAG25_NODE_204_length_11947_cov_29.018822_1_plen_47_part_10